MNPVLRVKRAATLIITVLACFAVYLVPSLLAQGRTEAEMVKSMVSLANGERPALISMSQARDQKGLNELFAEKSSWSKIGRIIYATRLYQLNSEKGGIAVLDSLPKSALEMAAFDEFAFEPDSGALRQFYRSYYDAAFKSVIKHPEFLNSVFSVAAQFYAEDWADDGDTDWYYSELAMVHRAIPVEYERAVMKEKPESRGWLRECGRGH